MKNIVTCRDINIFMDMVSKITDEYYPDLIFNVKDGQLSIKDSKENIYYYSEMEEEIKKPTDGEIFNIITLKEFVWNVNEFMNKGYKVKVEKGSDVKRNYYRDSFLKAYDEKGDLVPYSDIDFVEAYLRGLIIEKE